MLSSLGGADCGPTCTARSESPAARRLGRRRMESPPASHVSLQAPQQSTGIYLPRPAAAAGQGQGGRWRKHAGTSSPLAASDHHLCRCVGNEMTAGAARAPPLPGYATPVLLVIALVAAHASLPVRAQDTVTAARPLSGDAKLVSRGGKFAMGFFQPGTQPCKHVNSGGTVHRPRTSYTYIT